jgi:penicillin G amidase
MSFQTRETKVHAWMKWLSVALASVAALVIIAAIVVYLLVRASLPALDGNAAISGLSNTATITRDTLGTVNINAANIVDATRALGFVHAQERFFEMDLARRSAAGELSALLGKATVKMDEAKRIHRFRTRLTAALATLNADERAQLAAYTAGANAGLAALAVRPWQYLALRVTPEPWQEVDSLLVVAEMYSMLQGRAIEQAFTDAILRERVGDSIFQWLKPRGGSWDAALDDSVMPNYPMPTADQLNTRTAALPTKAAAQFNEHHIGSNAWAVSGAHTTHGGAMLSNDMHLGLQVPNIWFRAEVNIADSKRLIAGVTLPGIPGVVVGSNGDIAWGFTNSYGRWFDWVSAAGLPVQDITETITVKGEPPITLKIRETSLGPIAKSHAGRDYVLAWMAYKPNAINLDAINLANATNVDTALAVVQGAGMPHQNFFVADKHGKTAWTIAGLMPQRPNRKSQSLDAPRAGFATVEDVSYTPLAPNLYPVVKNAKLWSGNNRQLGAEGGALIGDGGFDLGARGQQMRDRLRATDKFSEQTLLNIQYDNEAIFVARWATLLKTISTKHPDIQAQLQKWNGRADADQVGYRIIRTFREKVYVAFWAAWLNSIDPALLKTVTADSRIEYAVWQALTDKPAHLLPKPFATWDEFLSAQLNGVGDDLIKAHGSIAAATWGERNKTNISHPFSGFLPALASYLNMPATPQAGDNNMPSVAGRAFGASQRLSVSPGRERDGILTMPGGQSGHPLSAFYGAGHDAWATQQSTPLLAGKTMHTLVLQIGK